MLSLEHRQRQGGSECSRATPYADEMVFVASLENNPDHHNLRDPPSLFLLVGGDIEDGMQVPRGVDDDNHLPQTTAGRPHLQIIWSRCSLTMADPCQAHTGQGSPCNRSVDLESWSVFLRRLDQRYRHTCLSCTAMGVVEGITWVRTRRA